VVRSIAFAILLAAQGAETPGSSFDASRAQALIGAFEDSDVDVRDRAAVELRKMMPAVAALIRKNLDHPDAEVRARCQDLLKPASKVLGPLLIGKIALVDEVRGVATDLRARDGTKADLRLDVYRAGTKIGSIVITDVQAWGSWAKPVEGTKLGDLQKGDLLRAP
jgi:hypothetical protein